MKKRFFELSVITAFFICIFSCVSFENDCQNIRDGVLRLHIIADSDSYEAQGLKLKVRDSILKEASALFNSKDSIVKVKQTADDNLQLLRNIAENTVRENGYTYPVRAELTRCFFPTREYDGAVFPAGEYEALRIVLGEGKGQNWWCVMFPPLCLSAADKKDELSDIIGNKEAEIITEPGKYRIRLWAVEKWYELKDYLRTKSS